MTLEYGPMKARKHTVGSRVRMLVGQLLGLIFMLAAMHLMSAPVHVHTHTVNRTVVTVTKIPNRCHYAGSTVWFACPTK